MAWKSSANRSAHACSQSRQQLSGQVNHRQSRYIEAGRGSYAGAFVVTGRRGRAGRGLPRQSLARGVQALPRWHPAPTTSPLIVICLTQGHQRAIALPAISVPCAHRRRERLGPPSAAHDEPVQYARSNGTERNDDPARRVGDPSLVGAGTAAWCLTACCRRLVDAAWRARPDPAVAGCGEAGGSSPVPSCSRPSACRPDRSSWRSARWWSQPWRWRAGQWAVALDRADQAADRRPVWPAGAPPAPAAPAPGHQGRAARCR
jgi:hypothetical protein